MRLFSEHRVYRTRLPHLHAGSLTHAVTIRLADALPLSDIQRILQPSGAPPEQERARIRRQLDEALDNGAGAAYLALPAVAGIVAGEIETNCECIVHAWVVMPNHVHLVVSPKPDLMLGHVIGRMKGRTGRRANAILGRTGSFWEGDYFDRVIRNERHLADAVQYAEWNPVRAGLCAVPEAWTWGSAHARGT